MENSAFVCDTCNRSYSLKRNLTRHYKEKHEETLYYPYTEYLCRGRFIRPGYLSTHLRKCHGIDEAKAKRLSQRVEKVQKQDSYTLFQYHSDISDISEDESFFDTLVTQQTFHSSSLHEEICENQKQNTDVAQEVCNSLQAFTDDLEQSYSQEMPMNDFEINSGEVFDFNVDELALEVEMEKIRADIQGTNANVSVTDEADILRTSANVSVTDGENIQETSTVQMDDVRDDFNANVDDAK